MKTQPDPRPTLTPTEVAHRLGWHRTVVERLCESGRLRAENIGKPGGQRYWRISEVWLQAYLDGQTAAPEAR